MEFENFAKNFDSLQNIKMEDITENLRNVNLEDLRENIENFNSKKFNAENFYQFKNAVVKIVNPAMETPKLIATKLFEMSKPALQEIGLFMVTCIGPWIFLLLCYLSTALISFSKYLSERLNKPEAPAINRAVAIIANGWSAFTSFYHDQTFEGLEHIPKDSAALLVWYHGPVPVDYIGLMAKIYKRDGRLINTIVDRSLPKLPGFENVQKYLKASASGKGYCVDLLENGELLGVAPGGSREALFDDRYSADWGNRTGFAKVALLTGAPIIPIFTENIREAYCTMSTGRKIWRYIFEQTKLPMIPIYGGFPVKLTTHIGTPIRARRDETADQLKERVQAAMEDMISTYQRSVPSVTEAVMDRMAPVLSSLEDLEILESGLAGLSDVYNSVVLRE